MNEAKTFWDERAKEPEAITPNGQWAPIHIERHVSDLLAGLSDEFLSKAVVLDIGCGEGRLMSVIAPKVWSYVGIDISTVALRRAQDMSTKMGLRNTCFCLADKDVPSDMLLPNGVYDLVFSWAVFMHMPASTFRVWLKYVAKWIKPGGHFRFQLNDQQAFCKRLDEHRFDNVSDDVFWTGRWYPEDVTVQWLHEEGFKVKRLPIGKLETWYAEKTIE